MKTVQFRCKSWQPKEGDSKKSHPLNVACTRNKNLNLEKKMHTPKNGSGLQAEGRSPNATSELRVIEIRKYIQHKN